jgi:phosphate transport system permease protein
VRISVNNLAGVPSIVYGVFGLGFFAYTMGTTIDQLFYPERCRARPSAPAASCGRR